MATILYICSFTRGNKNPRLSDEGFSYPVQREYTILEAIYHDRRRARASAVVRRGARTSGIAAVWNPRGYLWNAVDRVHLTVI
jgi:hypothetical protein